MSELSAELNELKSFVAGLKADRAAQKEKEQRELWTKHTSLWLVAKRKALWHLSFLLGALAAVRIALVWLM